MGAAGGFIESDGCSNSRKDFFEVVQSGLGNDGLAVFDAHAHGAEGSGRGIGDLPAGVGHELGRAVFSGDDLAIEELAGVLWILHDVEGGEGIRGEIGEG